MINLPFHLTSSLLPRREKGKDEKILYSYDK